MTEVAVVTPVYGNATTLAALAEQLGAALEGRNWRLRFVIDASPDDSLEVAKRLSAAGSRLAVTALDTNHGQHAALMRGLADEAGATAWVCLDADLQDPPAAVPLLVDRLAAGDVAAVFGGRRGDYEAGIRRATGIAHRALMRRLTGLPSDAGAFVAIGPAARDAILRYNAPSIVAAIGVSGLEVASVPVQRASRLSGRSRWTGAARLRHSARTLAWTVAARRRDS